MKKLLLTLVLINLAILGYFNLDLILPNAQNTTLVPINPEKIKLLSEQQIQVLPKKPNITSSPSSVTSPATLPEDTTSSVTPTPTKTTSTNNTCYEWGIFSSTNLKNAQSEAKELSLQGSVKEQNASEAKRFWVYKPPLKTLEAAQIKALELKALGVPELFVVQDAKWKNAISFGVFEDEELANKLFNELKAKGVKDVIKAVRNQGKGHASLKFEALTDAEVLELKKLKSKFPEADVKQVSCS